MVHVDALVSDSAAKAADRCKLAGYICNLKKWWTFTFQERV